MSKKTKLAIKIPGIEQLESIKYIERYKLKRNGLEVLYVHRPGTGVVTSNILYKVGARDEKVGETGLAHMLEHMLFKPTTHDKKRKVDSGAMQFERETGVILNANTWRDRTTYFFSYPTEHFKRALQIEAERMRDLTLTDDEFQPERGNVLSEFDMYNGDPYFALEVAMRASAFFNHPYGHETIGYRSDIEAYTVERLKAFYDTYYWPNNAVLMIVGDIDRTEALKTAKSTFGSIPAYQEQFPRHTITEAPQEGQRTVTIKRPTNTTLLGIGFKHQGFPSREWFIAQATAQILTGGPESVLHKALVDTGLAADVSVLIEPAAENNLGILFITASQVGAQEDLTQKALTLIRNLKASDIKPHLKKVQMSLLTSEAFGKDSSLGLVAEMVEYESADALPELFKTKQIISSIKPSDITEFMKQAFIDEQLTLGTLSK